MWVKVTSTTADSAPMFLNLTYHPPSSDPTATRKYLNESLSRISSAHPRSVVIIGGDFNRISLFDLEIEFCLSILDTPPTRGDAKLDLVLTNRPDLFLNATCFTPILVSDHKAVLVQPQNRNPPSRRRVEFTDYNFKGFLNLNYALESAPFSDIYSTEDVNVAAADLDEKVSICVKNAFPKRKVTMSDRDPPWITPKIKWLLQRKKRAKKSTSNQATTQISSRLESIKLKFFERHNSKLLWNNVDTVSHRKYSNKAIHYGAFDSEGLNIDLANRSALQPDTNRPKAPIFEKSNQHPPTLTLWEVAKEMKKCKRTSPGPSQIPHFIFSEFWDILAPHYLHVWNLSISQCVFPTIYKRADLIPLPKTKNACTAEDIRGISVTSISARLFERCVHKKWIQPQIESVGDSYQFAYKSRLSTIDCLLTLHHYILSLLDNRTYDGVHLILLDFSKAFDRINQELAAASFPTFIHSPYICQWLYDFITNRCQRLIWRKQQCSYVPIDLGCSQGTVGGPSIFSMYTNDLKSRGPSTKAFKYSDDTNIIVPCLASPTISDQQILQQELSHFEKEARHKHMTINQSKTKTIRFNLLGNLNCPCKQDGTYETVSFSKVLGVYFDSNCLFHTHGKQLIGSLKRMLYVIKDLKLNNFKSCDIDKVFDALILSRIRYGISIYGSDWRVLKKINSFLTKCFQKGHTSTLQTAEEILQREDKRLLHSIISNPMHPLLPFLTSCPTTNSNTRQKFTQLKPLTRTNIFANSFCNRVRPF